MRDLPSDAESGRPGLDHDQGWTTTWTYAGGEGTTDDCIAQSGITHDGDMALEMASSGAIEIGFPSVSSGILTKR